MNIKLRRAVRGVRMGPGERKEFILDVAMRMAGRVGYRLLKGPAVAREAGLRSHGLINHYFGGVESLKDAVILKAIEVEDLGILSQALVSKDPRVKDLPRKLKIAAYEQLKAE